MSEIENYLKKQFKNYHITTNGFITPEIFGAIGDGKTDDSAAFLKAAEFAAKNRKVLSLTKTYYLEQKISLPNYINIKGSLTNVTHIESDMLKVGINIIAPNGFIINGYSNFDNVGFQNYGVEIIGNRVCFDKCGFQECSTAITLNSTSTYWHGEIFIKNSYFSYCDKGIVSTASSEQNKYYTDCHVDNCIVMYGDIFLNGRCSGWQITNNHIYSTHSIIADYLSNSLILNNYFDTNDVAIIATLAGQTQIKNNQFYTTKMPDNWDGKSKIYICDFDLHAYGQRTYLCFNENTVPSYHLKDDKRDTLEANKVLVHFKKTIDTDFYNNHCSIIPFTSEVSTSCIHCNEDYLTLKNIKKDIKYDITGRYNVLDYGLDNKQNGSVNNSTLLSTMLSSIPEGSIVYFPQGVYVFHDTVEITKSVKFVGETIVKHRSNTESVLQPQSGIKFCPSESNKTLFVRISGEFDIEGLSFFTDNNYNQTYNDEAFNGTYPYNIWKSTITLEGINAIDCAYHGIAVSTGKPNNGTMSIVRNCTFHGFSGYAVAYEDHRYINDCSFLRCNKSIIFTGTDNMVQNSWFCSGGIGIYCSCEKYDFTNLEASNCWCDQMSEHFIACTNPKKKNSVRPRFLINNCWVDMIDKAAIYTDGIASNCRITGRFSRCGMSYAGYSEALSSAIKPSSSALCFYRLYDSYINISVNKREIGQENKVSNSKGVCPLVAVSSTDNIINKCNIILDGNYSDLVSNQSASRTTFITTDGIKEKYSIWDLDYQKVIYRTSSPIGKVVAYQANLFSIDTKAKIIYRSKEYESDGVTLIDYENTKKLSNDDWIAYIKNNAWEEFAKLSLSESSSSGNTGASTTDIEIINYTNAEISELIEQSYRNARS